VKSKRDTCYQATILLLTAIFCSAGPALASEGFAELCTSATDIFECVALDDRTAAEIGFSVRRDARANRDGTQSTALSARQTLDDGRRLSAAFVTVTDPQGVTVLRSQLALSCNSEDVNCGLEVYLPEASGSAVEITLSYTPGPVLMGRDSAQKTRLYRYRR